MDKSLSSKPSTEFRPISVEIPSSELDLAVKDAMSGLLDPNTQQSESRLTPGSKLASSSRQRQSTTSLSSLTQNAPSTASSVSTLTTLSGDDGLAQAKRSTATPAHDVADGPDKEAAMNENAPRPPQDSGVGVEELDDQVLERRPAAGRTTAALRKSDVAEELSPDQPVGSRKTLASEQGTTQASTNGITDWSYRSLTHLDPVPEGTTDLLLSYNALSTIQIDAFSASLQHLTILDLSHNYLTDLPQELALCGALREFYLQSNPIGPDLPAVLGELMGLEVLDVRGCRLERLDSKLRHLRSLRHLDIRQNKLAFLPPYLSTLTCLATFFVEDNPFVVAYADLIGRWALDTKPGRHSRSGSNVSVTDLPTMSRSRSSKLKHKASGTFHSRQSKGGHADDEAVPPLNDSGIVTDAYGTSPSRRGSNATSISMSRSSTSASGLNTPNGDMPSVMEFANALGSVKVAKLEPEVRDKPTQSKDVSVANTSKSTAQNDSQNKKSASRVTELQSAPMALPSWSFAASGTKSSKVKSTPSATMSVTLGAAGTPPIVAPAEVPPAKNVGETPKANAGTSSPPTPKPSAFMKWFGFGSKKSRESLTTKTPAVTSSVDLTTAEKRSERLSSPSVPALSTSPSSMAVPIKSPTAPSPQMFAPAIPTPSRSSASVTLGHLGASGTETMSQGGNITEAESEETPKTVAPERLARKATPLRPRSASTSLVQLQATGRDETGNPPPVSIKSLRRGSNPHRREHTSPESVMASRSMDTRANQRIQHAMSLSFNLSSSPLRASSADLVRPFSITEIKRSRSAQTIPATIPPLDVNKLMQYLGDLYDLDPKTSQQEEVKAWKRVWNQTGNRADDRRLFYGDELEDERSEKGVTLGDATRKPDPEARTSKGNPGKRARIIQEILATERSYVRGLEDLIEIYLAPCRAALPSDEVKAVFCNIENILMLHKTYLLPTVESEVAQLSKAQNNGVDNCNMGKVFLEMVPYLKMYSFYINNFDHAMDVLHSWQAGGKRRKAKALLESARSNPRHTQLNLQSYLLLPVQRIPRYQLLLGDLCMHTPTDHKDYPSLQNAVEEVGSRAEEMNERKRAYERHERVLEIQTALNWSLTPPLVQPHRRLVKEGPLFLLSTVRRVRSSKPSHQTPHDDAYYLVKKVANAAYSFFLFNDIMLQCRQLGSSPFSDTTMELTQILRLETKLEPASVRLLEDEPEKQEAILRVVDKEVVYYFKGSMDQMSSWKRAINTRW
ncbi:hypothetical protein BZG36_00422 [Bifiguratus adelaidae]|uniref:DH domain-containing protein n=1 Tax=Bifiguratus adelaidae TaxID=1938954 RepID=A0A261Y7S6_9FUNG|nr:hypothetical protein BZG36_00422 [Bifiguratus adelaidae]